MGKILVVAEKPSVGRDIGKVLGCKTKGEGCLIGEQYVVSWAIGHLVTLCEPEDYGPEYKKWVFGTLPILPEPMKIKGIRKTASQLKILKKWMNDKEINSIICATDSGREGELIFRYIYEIVKCKKPFQRLWISSMTDVAIREGFQKLKAGQDYDALYLSAKCRSEADWLVGMNATRAFTIQFHALLSIGRVQTPTLAMLVARQKEINAFVPKPYYEVINNYGKFTGLWFASGKERNSRILVKEDAYAIANKVKGKEGIVSAIETEEKKQLPPLLYDLTELQRDCNRRFGFSAQKTLTIAQSLYETKKLITYPRTDSRYLSSDMPAKIKSVLNKLSGVAVYQSAAAYVNSLTPLPLGKRIIDDSKISDHHAIIPTDGTIQMEKLSADEKKVFHAIVIRFLAVFYPPYIYDITRIITIVEKELFLSRGTTVKQEGWMALYRDTGEKGASEENGKKAGTAKEEAEEDQKLPALQVNDTVTALDSQVLHKMTKPPKPYTEAGLLSAMENAGRFVEEEEIKEKLKESGLGTPATRAAIIERLLKVGYIVRRGKTLIPTEKGMKLIEIVPEELKSPVTTGKWEKGLSSIAKGKMDPERFMGSIRRYVNYLIAESAKEKKDIVFEEEPLKGKGRKGAARKKSVSALGNCPLCNNGGIYENTKAFYCSQWKEGCRFTIWKNSLDAYGNTVDAQKVKILLKGEPVKGIKVTLPQTGDMGTADLVLKKDLTGAVELINLVRSDK